MDKLSYEKVCVPYDKALDEIDILRENWPASEVGKDFKPTEKGKANDAAYAIERDKIFEKFLFGTGWASDEVDTECCKRIDAALNK